LGTARRLRPVIPVYIGYCAVFKVREEQSGHAGTRRATKVLCEAGVGRSLKTQQHAAMLARTARVRRHGLPGSVDMLGPVRSELSISQTQWSACAWTEVHATVSSVRHPPKGGFPRKEVIQPQLPLRLPCYDFTPVTSPTFDGSLPQGVRPPASGVAHSHGVTGGVYKARERIHRGNADPRLLATPPSCRRVSACNPNRDAL
jgi:hypothetical protein